MNLCVHSYVPKKGREYPYLVASLRLFGSLKRKKKKTKIRLGLGRMASVYDWAIFNHNSFGRWAGSQGTTIKVISPPTEANVFQAQAKIQKHSHKGKASVECPGKNIVVTPPPIWIIPICNIPREKTCNNPSSVVDGRSWWHISCGTYQDRHVDELNPLLLWEGLCCQPD